MSCVKLEVIMKLSQQQSDCRTWNDCRIEHNEDLFNRIILELRTKNSKIQLKQLLAYPLSYSCSFDFGIKHSKSLIEYSIFLTQLVIFTIAIRDA